MMEKVAMLLVQFGQDFEYECRNSEGSEIMCYPADVRVHEGEGRVSLEHGQDTLDCEDNDLGWSRVLHLLNEILIDETT